MSHLLPLTRAQSAIVDDADYTALSKYKWSACLIHGVWYAVRCTRQRLGPRHIVSMHHAIMGKPPVGLQTDHVNGNGLDNRRANLRFVTGSQNQGNQRIRAGYSSRFKGVSWRNGNRRWRAQIGANGMRRHLGYFAAEEDAARAYDEAALAAWGNHANLNFSQQEAT